ncbi:hypothetical protein BBJ28_00020347 [Nothophytophthora sp. Chile5]|nr:hypothetical protein BBJ28_00020347 [Nothophytophthora sp. Chile5]
MSHDGYYASSRDDAPPPAPHGASASPFSHPAAPTTVHGMAVANGLQTTHVMLPPQLEGDGDQFMGDPSTTAENGGEVPRTGSALNLAQASVLDIVKEAKKVIATFLREQPCYDIIKNSGKVVVFDVKIPINLAFFALVEHGTGTGWGLTPLDLGFIWADIKSVPIWDAEQGKFVGMFTATDFVNILRHFYIRGSPMNELAEHSIASWRAIPRSLSMAPTREEMVSVTPENSLYDACKILRDNRLHRLPVIDPGQNSVLSVITHSGILEYLVATFREQRRLFDQPIFDLGIGVYSGFVTVPEDMPLIRVLHTLIERRGNVGEGLHLCYKTDTLHMIFERFAASKAHRFVCLDEYSRCVGIVARSRSLCQATADKKGKKQRETKPATHRKLGARRVHNKSNNNRKSREKRKKAQAATSWETDAADTGP